jgi:hypothetical protein
VGAKFSLDRYHVSSNSHGGLEVSDSTTFTYTVRTNHC